MRTIGFISLAVLTLCVRSVNAQGVDQGTPCVRTVNYKDIPDRVKIIGELGLPLYELATIRGRWIEVQDGKGFDIPTFAVESVNGKRLERAAQIRLVHSLFSTRDELKPNIGDAWEFYGIETAKFHGLPGNVLEANQRLYPNIAPASPVAFQFQTEFLCLKASRLSATPQVENATSQPARPLPKQRQ
jgi:hypothetical protein